MLRRLRIENLVLVREAELSFGPGLNAVTGETGAGKTIFAQAIGLLLGGKADATVIGSEGSEAYVEAEIDVPPGFFADEEVMALADLRPEDEPALVVARRIFADGRTRAYAWGRAIAREDVAAATERLISMSGQFEQRRLARPSYQLDVLDAFCGAEQLERRAEARRAWSELLGAQRRLEALVEATAGMTPGEEDTLLARRERLRHVDDLLEGAGAAAGAIAPDEGDGAAALVARAERAVAPLERLAPELAASAEELRDVLVRLGEVGSDLHRFLAGLDAEPGALEEVEGRLQEIADLKRRFAVRTFEELLERAASAERELADIAIGGDPVEAATRAVEQAEALMVAVAEELHAERRASADALGEAVAAELASLGMGEGEFLVELRERELGPTGRDEATFLIRPNPGLPFAPVADTASGGELSRVALALAAVSGDETLVFDEIDAGIGGVTAHAVAATLQRLAERAQVLTITHLPQIASVADVHFRVAKIPGDPTHTRIEELDEFLRREELERMAGGAEFIAALGPGAA